MNIYVVMKSPKLKLLLMVTLIREEFMTAAGGAVLVLSPTLISPPLAACKVTMKVPGLLVPLPTFLFVPVMSRFRCERQASEYCSHT